MKKIILVVLMTMMMYAICFAQAVEPEGIFSVDGTYWDVQSISLLLIAPSTFNLEIHRGGMGFYQGEIYDYSSPGWGGGYEGRYIDLGVVSIAYSIGYAVVAGYFFSAIIQPTIGWGVFTLLEFRLIPACGYRVCSPPFFHSEMGIMNKSIDNWTPPGIE